MTILDSPITAHNQSAPRNDNPTPPTREISPEDLVELVRTMRDTARRKGQRQPGRPSLAKTIGVSKHRVRQALEELAREDRLAQTIGRKVEDPAKILAAGAVNLPSPSGANERQAGDAPTIEHHSERTHPACDRAGVDGSDKTQPRSAAQAGSSVPPPHAVDDGKPAGAGGFYIVAAMSLLVSMDTSWRFFEIILHITDLRERIVMFAVLEVAQVACGWGMRANVQRAGSPGAPRLFAWLLCGLAGYMAWLLSGPAEGLARVALGPALGLVMLHLALGIEIRTRRAQTSTWARIRGELRERLLSRLGLADDERDALARTRQRAAKRVSQLSLGKKVWFRHSRAVRALRASNAAHDQAARKWLLEDLAATRHISDLATLPQPSPWRSDTTSTTGADTANPKCPTSMHHRT